MTCIVTIIIIIGGEQFQAHRRLEGTFEGTSGAHYLINFESSVPELNKPVRVLKSQCFKG